MVKRDIVSPGLLQCKNKPMSIFSVANIVNILGYDHTFQKKEIFMSIVVLKLISNIPK